MKFRLRKYLLSRHFLSLALVLVSLSGLLLAAPGLIAAPTPMGPPPAQHLGKVGFLLHFDGTVWILEWTSNKGSHTFEGRLVCSREGEINSVISNGFDEKIDILEENGRIITFSSKLKKGEKKAIVINTTSARVSFDLLVDGKRVRKKILIGQTGLHPDSVPFALIP